MSTPITVSIKKKSQVQTGPGFNHQRNYLIKNVLKFCLKIYFWQLIPDLLYRKSKGSTNKINVNFDDLT